MFQRNFRLSLTEAGLSRGYFFLFKIPPPTSIEYKDHSVRFSQSQGGLALHGYIAATLFWEQLTTTQAHKLRTKISASLDGSGFLYMTVPKGNGSSLDVGWIDVRGVPQMPDFTSDGRVAGSSGLSIFNTQLILNNITVIDDPADFST